MINPFRKYNIDRLSALGTVDLTPDCDQCSLPADLFKVWLESGDIVYIRAISIRRISKIRNGLWLIRLTHGQELRVQDEVFMKHLCDAASKIKEVSMNVDNSLFSNW